VGLRRQAGQPRRMTLVVAASVLGILLFDLRDFINRPRTG
jgi:hypothetical protein